MPSRIAASAILGRGAAALLLISFAAACSGSENKSPATATVENVVHDHQATSSAALAASLPTMNITALDFSFDAPDTVPAGLTRVAFHNSGQAEHHAQLARLHDGVSYDDLLAALKGDNPDAALGMVSFAGGAAVVGTGGSGDIVLNLQPGPHVLVCLVSGDDGVPHVAKGMIKQLQVTGVAIDTAFPPSQATVTLRDFGFDAPATLPAGHTVLQVTNSGQQPHEMAVLRLEGITIDQLAASFAAEADDSAPAGPPPFSFAGGINALDPGTTGQVTLALTPGEYGLICFVPDPATGKPHVALGMISGFTVQ